MVGYLAGFQLDSGLIPKDVLVGFASLRWAFVFKGRCLPTPNTRCPLPHTNQLYVAGYLASFQLDSGMILKGCARGARASSLGL